MQIWFQMTWQKFLGIQGKNIYTAATISKKWIGFQGTVLCQATFLEDILEYTFPQNFLGQFSWGTTFLVARVVAIDFGHLTYVIFQPSVCH